MSVANKLTGTDPRPKPWGFNGFKRGVDTYSLDTEVHKNALSDAENMELFGRGSIRPRRGSSNLGASMGNDPVDGLFTYDDSSVNELLGLSGGTLKKYNISTEDWDSITGGSFTSGLRARGVQLRDNFYFGNGADDMAKYDGSSVSTFTTQTAPAGLGVSPVGATGTEKYSYQVTTVTANGESLPCTAVEITNGNAELSTSNYNQVQWTRKTDSSVIGYNVYGRQTTGLGRTLITFIDQPASGASVTWNDTGAIDPTIWLPPEGDSTGGAKMKVIEQLRGSLIGFGDPNQRDRLFWSGTGERYESFSPSHNGGWADVRRGDGDGGVTGGGHHEKNYYVFKRKSIHKFYFDSNGDGVLEEVILGIGCGAPGSVAFVENDLIYLDSNKKLRVLGYEPNYYGTIRTATISEGRVQSYFDELDDSSLDDVEAVYFDGRYLLAGTRTGSTYNDVVIPYDRRYLAFLGKWTGWNVRCWITWDGIGSEESLYAGSSTNGQVFRVMTGRNDNTTAVSSRLVTRNEDLGNFSQSKFWEWADFRFYAIRGTLKIKTIVDGAMTIDERTITSQTFAGMGAAMPGAFMPGEATGTGLTYQEIDRPYRKTIEESARTLKFEVTKDGYDDDFTLVSIQGRALPEPEEVFDSSYMI